MFDVGQKVVCVDDRCRVQIRRAGWFERWRSWITLDHNLNRGDVYRVVKVEHVKTFSGIFLTLHVDGAHHFRLRQIGFPSFQFRPLIEKKTSIAIFTAMLNNVPLHEKENAESR